MLHLKVHQIFKHRVWHLWTVWAHCNAALWENSFNNR